MQGLCCFVVACTLLHAGTTHVFSADAAFLEKALVDPAQWTTPEFEESWQRPPVEADATVSRAALKTPAELFGAKIESACARMVGGRIHSISVVFLDAGYFFGYQNSNLPNGESFEAGKARFDEEFGSRKRLVLDGLKKLGAGSGESLELGTRSGLKMKAALFTCGKGFARVISYDHQLLSVDLFRTSTDAKTLHCGSASGNQPHESTLLAAKNPSASPERRLPVVPMVPQGNRGYCGVAILAMVSQWLGLQPGAEEYAAMNGFLYGADHNPDIRELFGAVAREAGVKAQRSPKFEALRMRQSIDQGMPVVVFRYWSQERDYIHSAYSARIAKGEKAELPQASMDDRKSWPGKKSPAHASVINGYRDDKREVVFTESWGEQARNRRMRTEEMEGTSYYAVYFNK